MHGSSVQIRSRIEGDPVDEGGVVFRERDPVEQVGDHCGRVRVRGEEGRLPGHHQLDNQV